MSIFTRTRDIIAANFSDLLDKAEDPGKMIRMIIAEMEETLVEVRTSAQRSIVEQAEMRRQIGRLERLQASWGEKAELALSKGREDLARGALIEKERAADMAGQLHAEIALLDDALAAAEQDVDRLQNRLAEARTRQNAIVSRLESANSRARARELHAGARVDEAFARFERLENRVDQAEGRADSLSLAGPVKSLEDEIAELAAADRVDAELEALKTARKIKDQ